MYRIYIDDNSLQLDPIQEIMEFLNVDDESLLNDMINNKIKTVTAKTFCNGFCDNSVLLSCRKSQNISKSKL